MARTTSATSAIVLATEFGPFEITAGTNDQFKIDVNNIGAIEIDLPAGVYTAVEMAAAIRTTLVAAGGLGPATAAALKMYDDGQGRLIFESVTTGAASEIEIVVTSTPAENSYDELGLTIAVTTGAAAGSNTTYDGTLIWLANPKNFIFGMVDDTRIYSEFNKDYDRYEFVIYNQVAFNVENLEAIVKITNLKRGL